MYKLGCLIVEKNMKNIKLQQKIKDVFTSGQVAHKRISELKPKEKASLEKSGILNMPIILEFTGGSKVDRENLKKWQKNIE